jgi:hypothetical protein
MKPRERKSRYPNDTIKTKIKMAIVGIVERQSEAD